MEILRGVCGMSRRGAGDSRRRGRDRKAAASAPQARGGKQWQSNIFLSPEAWCRPGQGHRAASLGRLLKQRGLHVKVQKLDPYLNVDPGTMSPYQHGEVFVTDDGAETDLDLGHYERFIDENLDKNSSVSSGQIYWEVLSRERRGDFLGGTVQIIPHITGRSSGGSTLWTSLRPTWPLWRSAAPWATLSPSPSWRPSGRCGGAGEKQCHVYPRVPHCLIPGTGELKSKPPSTLPRSF